MMIAVATKGMNVRSSMSWINGHDQGPRRNDITDPPSSCLTVGYMSLASLALQTRGRVNLCIHRPAIPGSSYPRTPDPTVSHSVFRPSHG